jgi:hypothetical protein
MTQTSDAAVTDDLILETPAPEPTPAVEEPTPVDGEKSDIEIWLAEEASYLEWKRSQTVERDWVHETIEYEGDTLGIRVPTQAALTAFTLGTGEFTPDFTRQGMTSMFIQNHLSPRSYGHVFRRMMDPDDAFDDAALGGLMRVLVEEASKKIIDAQKAKTESDESK